MILKIALNLMVKNPNGLIEQVRTQLRLTLVKVCLPLLSVGKEVTKCDFNPLSHNLLNPLNFNQWRTQPKKRENCYRLIFATLKTDQVPQNWGI